MGLGLTALISGVLVAGMIYYPLSLQIPDGFEDPLFLRFIFTMMELYRKVGNIKEYFYDPKDIIVGMRGMLKKQAANLPVKDEDMEFNGVKVRVFTPEGLPASTSPAVVYFHGGGWVIGSIDSVHAFCQTMAHQVQAVVISVEYRLAPEHPFPTPLDDCVSATTYVMQHAQQLGIDKTRVALSGDSAGGNLAAATALRLRDSNFKPQPKLQVLIYPCLQAIDFNSPSYVANTHDSLLPRKTMALFWSLYATGQSKYRDHLITNNHVTSGMKSKMAEQRLNPEVIEGKFSSPVNKQKDEKPGDERIWKELEKVLTDPYFAPLMAENVAGVPEALVYTMEQDVLRDDGIWYANELEKAGVKVIHRHDKSGFHGMATMMFKKANFLKAQKMIYEDLKAKL